MGNERISVLVASKELGLSPQGVRIQMQRGLLPIGYVVDSVQGNEKRYLIYRSLLDKFLGKEPAN